MNETPWIDNHCKPTFNQILFCYHSDIDKNWIIKSFKALILRKGRLLIMKNGTLHEIWCLFLLVFDIWNTAGVWCCSRTNLIAGPDLAYEF